jgi:hypothetical protein
MESIIEAFQDIRDALGAAYVALSYTWFIVLPFIFYFLFKERWMDYIIGKFLGKIDYVLLEIVPPANIERSPKPMESFFSGLAGVFKSFNPLEEYIEGMITYRFSLEMASSDGLVRFYIRTPRLFRNLVESHLYGQYPDVEVYEVPDYVREVPMVVPNKDWDLWGTDFELTADDALPIRTYNFFEEDVTGKMIDPLANLIEAMGKIGPNQKIWLQYVICPLSESWVNEGKEIVEKLAGRASAPPPSAWSRVGTDMGDVFRNIGAGLLGGEKKFTPAKAEGKEQQPVEFRLTPGEKKILEALESNIGKNVFRTKMRFIYVGRRENFGKENVSSFVGGIKQYSDMNLNGFKPNDKSKTYANFLFKKSRLRYRQRKLFQRYLTRNMTGKTFVLSTEELATVFHLPDMLVLSPYLQRVVAKRGGAPTNLPIQR